MNQSDSSPDYYAILGCDESASLRDIERLYKRLAAQHHPDRGGNESEMKALNAAYAVLKDENARQEYDSRRRRPVEIEFTPVSGPPARDVGLHGQALSAFLCLLIGLFLLCLVRFQWIWFLWPLAILAVFVIIFGILLAHAAMLSFNESLRPTHPIRRHTVLQEAIFWTVAGGCGFGLYLLLSA